MVMYKRVFLWKPTKVKGKWKWLCFVYRKKAYQSIVVDGRVVHRRIYEYWG